MFKNLGNCHTTHQIFLKIGYYSYKIFRQASRCHHQGGLGGLVNFHHKPRFHCTNKDGDDSSNKQIRYMEAQQIPGRMYNNYVLQLHSN